MVLSSKTLVFSHRPIYEATKIKTTAHIHVLVTISTASMEVAIFGPLQEIYYLVLSATCFWIKVELFGLGSPQNSTFSRSQYFSFCGRFGHISGLQKCVIKTLVSLKKNFERDTLLCNCDKETRQVFGTADITFCGDLKETRLL